MERNRQQFYSDVARAVQDILRTNPKQFYVTRTGNNVILQQARSSGTASGGSTSCPFDAAIVGDFFRFTRPGDLSPVGLATNFFDGNEFFSGEITADVMFVVGKGSTNGIVPTSWTIELRTDPAAPIPATPETAPAEFEFNMYAILGRTNLYRVIDCGNLKVSAVEYMKVDNPEPVCGADPKLTFFTWEVETVAGD